MEKKLFEKKYSNNALIKMINEVPTLKDKIKKCDSIYHNLTEKKTMINNIIDLANQLNQEATYDTNLIIINKIDVINESMCITTHSKQISLSHSIEDFLYFFYTTLNNKKLNQKKIINTHKKIIQKIKSEIFEYNNDLNLYASGLKILNKKKQELEKLKANVRPIKKSSRKNKK